MWEKRRTIRQHELSWIIHLDGLSACFPVFIYRRTTRLAQVRRRRMIRLLYLYWTNDWSGSVSSINSPISYKKRVTIEAGFTWIRFWLYRFFRRYIFPLQESHVITVIL